MVGDRPAEATDTACRLGMSAVIAVWWVQGTLNLGSVFLIECNQVENEASHDKVTGFRRVCSRGRGRFVGLGGTGRLLSW